MLASLWPNAGRIWYIFLSSNISELSEAWLPINYHVHIWQLSCSDICQTFKYWGRDKIDAIFQTTCLNAFSWMKLYKFQWKFHWGLFLKVQLTIPQHWLRWWLDADQATSHYLHQWWLVYWRIYASLGLNELAWFIELKGYLGLYIYIWLYPVEKLRNRASVAPSVVLHDTFTILSDNNSNSVISADKCLLSWNITTLLIYLCIYINCHLAV